MTKEEVFKILTCKLKNVENDGTDDLVLHHLFTGEFEGYLQALKDLSFLTETECEEWELKFTKAKDAWTREKINKLKSLVTSIDCK